MYARLVLRALFKNRNIGTLIILLGLSALLTDSSALTFVGGAIPAVPSYIAFPASLAIYAAMTIQTLFNSDFRENFQRKEKEREIRKLNDKCASLFSKVKKNTNNFYLQKLKKVYEDKEGIYNSYLSNRDSYLKENIAKQSLNLAISYMRLLDNFCIRSRELSATDQKKIIERINENSRKLNFARDGVMAENLRKIIEIDEKLVERINEEKRELEKIGAKLDYIESTISMFKHQMLSSIEKEEMLESLEKAVNEAEAPDTVLERRRKAHVNSLRR